MPATLWIPARNEGTRTLEYGGGGEGKIPVGPFSCIYHTLEQLSRVLRDDVFEEVVISDDGSTDDTRQGVEDFKNVYGLHGHIRVIGESGKNRGKLYRFFEMLETIRSDVVVMTDADLIHTEGPTFDKLADVNEFGGNHMLVSYLGEYERTSDTFMISGESSSGTRSIIRERVLEVMRKHDISKSSYPGQGYGLEAVLRAFVKGNLDMGMIKEISGKCHYFYQHLEYVQQTNK